MAGRVPVDLTKTPQRKVGMPLPQANLAPIEAKRRQGMAVASGIDAVGRMGAEYAQQYKNTDMQADEAAFSLFSKDRMTQASDAASRTSDPDEVRSIYEQAESDIDSYVGGRSPEGTPNVKWKDHQQDLRNRIQPIKGRIKEVSSKRVLDIYRADTQAKAGQMASESIARDDIEGVKLAASILQESGVYTSEQAQEYIGKGEAQIAENQKARGYNQMTEYMAKLAYDKEMGVITNAEEIDALNEAMEQVDSLHEDYQSVMKSRIYSRQTKAYKREKKELYNGFTRIAKGMETGDYDENELRYFMGAHVESYDELVLVANQARRAVGEYKGAGGVAVLTAVQNAISGEKDGEAYTITDAFKDMKSSESAVAPLGAVILGAAMMSPDSGADEEAIYKNWSVDVNPGFGRKPVPVSPDSLISETVRMMGSYVSAGDKDSKWIEDTFDSAIKIQNSDKIPQEEKLGKVRELFKGRARLLSEEVSAPQVQAKPATVSTQEEYDALQSGTQYIHPDGSTRVKK